MQRREADAGRPAGLCAVGATARKGYARTLAGLPTTVAPGATSRVTTAPAPTRASSPIRTPGRMIAPPPIHTLAPMLIGRPNSSPDARSAGIARMVGGQDLHARSDLGLGADGHRHDVEDHAIEVQEGAIAETDVEAVVAVERRPDRRAPACEGQALGQQGVTPIDGQVQGVEPSHPGDRRGVVGLDLRVAGVIELAGQHQLLLGLRHGYPRQMLTPSLIVSVTFSEASFSGSVAVGSADSTAKSASLPGTSDPFVVSSKC